MFFINQRRFSALITKNGFVIFVIRQAYHSANNCIEQ